MTNGQLKKQELILTFYHKQLFDRSDLFYSKLAM